MGEVVRRRAVARGVVQGVGYRAGCAAQARRLGLEGWVRNLPEGTVEIEVQGPPAAVGYLLEWCGHGPPGAHVEGIDLRTFEPAPGGTGFRVLPYQPSAGEPP